MKMKTDKRFKIKGKFFNFDLLYDYNAGKKNRWTLIKWDSGDALVVGREIPLFLAKRVIKALDIDWDALTKGLQWPVGLCVKLDKNI